MATLLRSMLALLIASAFAGGPALAQDHGGDHAADAGQQDTTHAGDDHAGDTHAADHGDDHAADGHGDTHGGHGDGHGHGSPSPIAPTSEGIIPSVMTLIVFGGVVAFLGAGVWPKINKGLQERQDKILGEIEAAEDARKQAKAALEQYEASLAEARAEAQKMIDETKTQQAALAAELRAKNEAEAADLRERARKDIESAKRAALSEIYSQTAMLATTVASKILEREVSSDDQERLVQEALGELQGSSN